MNEATLPLATMYPRRKFVLGQYMNAVAPARNAETIEMTVYNKSPTNGSLLWSEARLPIQYSIIGRTTAINAIGTQLWPRELPRLTSGCGRFAVFLRLVAISILLIIGRQVRVMRERGTEYGDCSISSQECSASHPLLANVSESQLSKERFLSAGCVLLRARLKQRWRLPFLGAGRVRAWYWSGRQTLPRCSKCLAKETSAWPRGHYVHTSAGFGCFSSIAIIEGALGSKDCGSNCEIGSASHSRFQTGCDPRACL